MHPCIVIYILHRLSPHIYLKRSSTGVNQEYLQRLDKVLFEKAESGVKVYILLYYESKHILATGSEFAKSHLTHHNIKVIRHPQGMTEFWWSHHEKIVVVDRSMAFVGGIDLAFGRWDTHLHCCVDNYFQYHSELGQTWLGKDYKNVFVTAEKDPDKPMKDYVVKRKREEIPLRKSSPRMPWHDVMCSFGGEAARDVTRHFIQRYNSNKEKCDPKIADPHIIAYGHGTSPGLPFIQVLRSVDQWSIKRRLEASIQGAYINAIKNAEHFIYIENQFFISSQPKQVKNQIMSALAKRIAKAYHANDTFRVVIVMPLKPEFDGDWDGYRFNGLMLREVSRLTFATLYRGKHSLKEKLIRSGVPEGKVDQYFSVYGLRTHDVLVNENKPSLVTEIVYVHSKMMIVDDKLSIIGSANINDRSMLGKRDSEIAVIIEDKDMINGYMDGRPCKVGRFSHSLRCHLFREHLGLLSEESSESSIVNDPVISTFYNDFWRRTARKNTAIYEEVFGGKIDPPNSVQSYKDLKKWKKKEGIADINTALKHLDEVHGHLVLFPEDFLKKESMKTLILSKVVEESGVIYIINLEELSDRDLITSLDLAGVVRVGRRVDSLAYLDPACHYDQEEVHKMLEKFKYCC